MASYREISVFVSHTFKPTNNIYTLDEFRKSIYVLLENVRSHLEKSYIGFSIKIIVEMLNYGQRLPALIDQHLSTAHFGIVDISANSPNVFYELGQLTARNVPIIIIKSQKSKCDIPADINNRLIYFYNKIKDVETALQEKLSAQFKEIIEKQTIPNKHINMIWFKKNIPYIHLICGPELEKTKFAYRSSPNYIFMDTLEDKDSLVELLMFLSRQYPNTRMVRYASDNIPPDIIEGDLVVIGGPGEIDGPGNVICKQMMERINSRFSYSDDVESLIFKGKKYNASYDRNEYIERDLGYFASFPNPYNKTSRVILVNGIHTYGTFGASLVFSDHPSTKVNIHRILENFSNIKSKDLAFECFFEVNVLHGGGVSCPQVEYGNIIKIDI